MADCEHSRRRPLTVTSFEKELKPGFLVDEELRQHGESRRARLPLWRRDNVYVIQINVKTYIEFKRLVAGAKKQRINEKRRCKNS